ncbi:MAG: ABC transporter ATP-binding protein [Pseudomonadota bacterium]
MEHQDSLASTDVADAAGRASLRAEGIAFAPKRGAPFILHPMDFAVPPRSVLGIVGPNGAGKSTLLRMIYRYQRPSEGRIWAGSDDIWQTPPRVIAKRIAAVLQEQPSSFGLTVREIVALGRVPHRGSFAQAGANDDEIVDRTLARLGLTGFAHREVPSLSGGERQRVMVARALVQEPEILVMDEPTNHLDIRHQLEVLELIRGLDLTIVVSLHDLNMAADVCDTVLLIENGQARGFGAPCDVLTEARVSSAFRVTARRERLSLSDADHFSYHLPNQEKAPL